MLQVYKRVWASMWSTRLTAAVWRGGVLTRWSGFRNPALSHRAAWESDSVCPFTEKSKGPASRWWIQSENAALLFSALSPFDSIIPFRPEQLSSPFPSFLSQIAPTVVPTQTGLQSPSPRPRTVQTLLRCLSSAPGGHRLPSASTSFRRHVTQSDTGECTVGRCWTRGE